MAPDYGFDETTALKEKRVDEKDLVALRNWSLTEPAASVPPLTQQQLILFLLCSSNDLEAAKNTIVAYYATRSNAPELFDDRTLTREDLQGQLKTVEFSVFPVRTDDGCAILFHRLHDPVYSHYFMEPAMKLLFMSLDAVLYGDQPPKALIILFDMKGVGLMHLTKAKLSLIKHFFHYAQEGLPIRLQAIHVLNVVYFLDKVINLVKPFMNKHVWDLLHFHQPDADMNEFYHKHIPKRCLPQDFGGDLPDTRTLHDQNTAKLAEMQEFFRNEQKQRH